MYAYIYGKHIIFIGIIDELQRSFYNCEFISYLSNSKLSAQIHIQQIDKHI